MRRFRAFTFFAGNRLKRKSFWAFLAIAALVGPIYVILDSQTQLDVWENRPLLSETATVEHFNTGRSATGFVGGLRDAAVQLFRMSETETPFGNYVSPVFAPGRLSRPRKQWPSSILPLAASSTLFDFHRHILPILMLVIGILALPSRQRMSVLSRLLPCGRLGFFLMIVGSLVTHVALLVLLSDAFTAAALAITQGLPCATATSIARYSGMVFIYAMAFAFLGLVVGGVMRSRTIALMIGLALVIGVLPFASLAHARWYSVFLQWASAPSASAAMENPLLKLGMSLLMPPQWALNGLPLQMQWGTSTVSWGALSLFMTFWLCIAWIAFPRLAKDVS